MRVRNPLRLLARSSAPSPPEAGFRSLYPKADGWYDLDEAGVETRLGSSGSSSPELYDSVSAPDGVVSYPYLRFVRDADGDVQQIILGTAD